jgi:hypothetical protein
MGKKCVLWAKPVLVTLTVLIAVNLQGSGTALSAQSTDPLQLPRLAFADFTYRGGFRLPREIKGNDSFSYGGQHLAYNPARNSLFGSSLRNNVAEISIPEPVNTADVNKMPFATYLQGFSDPTEGHFREIEQGGPNPAVIAGLLVDGNRLYGTGSIYYDAMNSQVVSHFSHSTNLSEPSFSGMSQVWQTGKAGFVGGYMTNVPAEWQPLLGGPALTGQCCIPIVTRTSFGPGAFSFNPVGVGTGTLVPASPLLYYTKEHATLGPWEGSNPLYGATTGMGGVAVISGTRTALFIGRNGQGKYCYGYGVSDPALEGTRAADGQLNCYDPASSDKGMHAYPYRYQIWAYDLADFAAVKAGSKQPWDVVPYAVWPFDLPTPERTVRIGGVAYDAQRQLLYISQFRADTDGYSERPIVHVLKINVPSSTAPPPLSTTMVSLIPSLTPPQQAGTSVTWTAVTTGANPAYEYKWFVTSNGVTTLAKDWSASSTFTWQTAVAASDARVVVWTRAAGSAADAFEAKAEYPFPVTAAPSSDTTTIIKASTTVSGIVIPGIALNSSVPAPQPAGSTIVWTATPASLTGPLLYKWFVSNDGVSWRTIGSWTTSNQFTWTPVEANPNYRVSVWVKRASNPADEREVSTERPFAITASNTTATPASSLALTTNVPSPQPPGSPIVWTASPTGGSGAMVYRWFVSSNNGASWSAIGSWSPSNQFTWTPTAVGQGYRVSAWVKRASNPADEREASAERPFTIAQTSTPVSSVTLSTNLAAPQMAGSSIVWTATATGGTGSIVYKWFVSNDGASWSAAGSWTASNQFTWTPAVANQNYRVSVWAKRASNPADEREASAELPFAIAAPSFPVASASLTANLAAPQEVSSTIVWTATPAGGTGPLVFKWLVSSDGVTWNAAGPWSASNQFAWTPQSAGAGYRVSVWVKRASNPVDAAEASAEQPFSIYEPLIGVALSTDVPSPQRVANTIEWTATPAGASGAVVFKWFISEDDGVSWSAIGPWTASSRMTWTPTSANPRYRLSVWAKHAANASELPEASAQRRFVIKAN